MSFVLRILSVVALALAKTGVAPVPIAPPELPP